MRRPAQRPLARGTAPHPLTQGVGRRPPVRIGCAVGTRSSTSLPLPDPYRSVRWFDSPVDNIQQFAAHRLKIDRVPEPRGESRNGRLRVVAGAVKAAIYGVLDPYS